MPLPKNQITIDEFRSNHEHYLERMQSGEVFSFVDFDQNRSNLHEPINNKGIPIDIEEVKF